MGDVSVHSAGNWKESPHERVDTLLFRSGFQWSHDLSHGTNLLPTTPPIARGLESIRSETPAVRDYDDPVGRSELREAIAHYESTAIGIDVSAPQVTVTAGAREALFWSYACLKGKHSCKSVLVIGPQYPAVHSAILANDMTLAELLGNGFALEPSIDEVVSTIAELRPDVVHLTTPGNPSGRLWPEQDLRLLAESTVDTGTWIVLDKVCADISSPSLSAVAPVAKILASIDLNRDLMVVDSLSKRRSVAGLRLGYLVAPNKADAVWVQRRIFGGTQISLAMDGVIADLEASTALSLNGGTGFLSPTEREVWATIVANHETIRYNCDVALSVFGSLIREVTPLHAGQNITARLEVSSDLDDQGLVRACLLQGVGVYPLTCFLARDTIPWAGSIRITLSTPRDAFEEACVRVRAAVLSR